MTNSRDIGARTELDLFKRVLLHFPGATRTRVGDHGADVDPESVGGRAFEITRAGWEKMSTKCKQVAQAAIDAGVEEWVILKKTEGWHGSRTYRYAILDADRYLAQAAEVDYLRDQLRIHGEALAEAEADVEAAFARGLREGLKGTQEAAQ
jgi:hypothetical protein